MRKSRSERPSPAALSNIDAVARLESEFLAQRTLPEKIADAIGNFVGTMSFVAVHVLWFTVWFVWNSGVIPSLDQFDPYPFTFLTMAVSAEAVLLSTFVLMKQNRMSRRADQREHLNLQISLLAEKEITKALQLLERISAHQGIEREVIDDEARELTKNTAVERLAKELKRKLPD